MGFSSITYSEMKAYFDLYSIDPQAWEIDAIKMFDNIAYKFAKKEQEQRELENKSKHKQRK